MKKPLVNAYQENSFAEANRISTLGDRRLFDHVFHRILHKPTGGKVPDGETIYFGDDCKVTYQSGDRAVGCIFQIAIGVGFRKFSSADQPDPNLPEFTPVAVPVATNVTANPSDPTNPRIDRIFLKPAPRDGDAASKNVINPGTGAVAPAVVNTTREYYRAFEYVAGTPAASPAAPPAPTGYTASDCIAELRINAGSGAFDTSLLTDFRTKAAIASDVQGAWSTGDIKSTFKAAADPGWVMLNDGTIGESGSGATARANDDTWPLYALLYANVSDTWAPVAGGRTTAAADFAAGKVMTLPKALGRALAVAGAGAALTSRALGEVLGEEGHAILATELPPHAHSMMSGSSFLNHAAGANVPSGSGTGAFNTGDGPGLNDPANVMQPTFFANVMIKL